VKKEDVKAEKKEVKEERPEIVIQSDKNTETIKQSDEDT
jgi:hypothetical protein